MRSTAALVLIIIVLAVLSFFAIVKAPQFLAQHLSQKLGVSVSIESMSFGFSKVKAKKFEIGNPKGYTLPRAFSAQEIEVKAPVTHYFKEEIVIDEVEVGDIYLGLEFDSDAGAKGNWSRVLNHFEKSANLGEEKGKKILVKKMVFTNIQTELLFKNDGGTPKRLPVIKKIVLTNVSTHGGFPVDQLMGSILGQMLKEVFTQQRLNTFLKGLLVDPQKSLNDFISPFKDLLNLAPQEEKECEKQLA